MHKELGDYHCISLRDGNALGLTDLYMRLSLHCISLRNGNALGLLTLT